MNSRMWPAILGTALLGGVVVAAPAPPAPERVTADAIKKRLHDTYWRELYRVDRGEVFHRYVDLNCWGFENPLTWKYDGVQEISNHIYSIDWIDTSAEPMRLDMRFSVGSAKSIVPGIFRFEGKRFVWVVPAGPGGEGVNFFPPDPKHEYKTRPTGFTSTKDNGYHKRVLIPLEGNEQQVDPKLPNPDPPAKP